MAARKKSVSIFKNIHAQAAKKEACYTDLRNVYTSGEGTYLAASAKFFSVGKTGGGGPVLVHPLEKTGRIDLNAKVVNVHKGKVLDMKFSPFNDNFLGTAAEDCKIQLTMIPEGGLTENISKSDQTLDGHTKKVGHIQFNPAAENVLASGSYDRTVRTWDVAQGENVSTFEDIQDNIYSLEWDYQGKMLAVTSKDKQIRLFDPRAPESVAKREVFDAVKASKCFWCDKDGRRVGAVGYTKKGKRALRIFDIAKMDAKRPLFNWDIDQASSVFMPYFDYDAKMLYLAGKGEGTIMWFELNDETNKLQKGALQYRNTIPSKGGCWLPKLGVDVLKCELNRFLKLERNQIVPISLIVPRKVQGQFQEDIFPPTRARTASIKAGEFFEGKAPEITHISMDPAESQESGPAQVFEKAKSWKEKYDDLANENDALKSRIKELETEIAELKS